MSGVYIDKRQSDDKISNRHLIATVSPCKSHASFFLYGKT